MSKRNRHGSKKGSIDINEIVNRQLAKGELLGGDKTERLNIRVTPAIMVWLRKQGNMSKYIIGLIVDDMVNRGE